MKNFLVKGAIPVVAFISILACNTKVEEPVVVDKEAIKAEIQAKENDFADLYNSGEFKSIGYYAEDAITYYQNRRPIVGMAERMEFLKEDLDSNYNSITFNTREVFPSSDGNMVVEIGYYTVSDSSKIVINTGHYMSLFEKRNGKFVCLRDMSASDIELP